MRARAQAADPTATDPALPVPSLIPLSQPLIGPAERAAVDRVLRSGRLANGPETERFEHAFAGYCRTAHAIGVANGTSALWLALLALGIGPGDEVIIPSFTFVATANAVRLIGATPIFADIEAESFAISAHSVEPHLTERTAAVIAVHLYGHPAPMDRLRTLCDRHSLALLEDAAQAHGAALHRRRVGGWGDLATFSFYATKNMTTGEGGMITTDDPELAGRLRLLRNHGMVRRYDHQSPGTNERMSEMEAAMGCVQLRRLDRWNSRRRTHASALRKSIGDGPTPPSERVGAHHVFHQFTLRVAHRDRVIDRLERAGVGHGVYYPVPCHRQPAFARSLMNEPLIETDRAAREVLSVPVRPDLRPDELVRIQAVLASLGEEHRPDRAPAPQGRS